VQGPAQAPEQQARLDIPAAPIRHSRTSTRFRATASRSPELATALVRAQALEPEQGSAPARRCRW
jgi:hypothetical protein